MAWNPRNPDPSNPWARPTTTERTAEIQASLRAADEQADTFRPGPGMGEDGRCMTCDGRYCGSECHGRPGYVWLVGYGWASPQVAKTMEARGRTVYWDQPFTPERYGL
jgi:hypothetical protein